MKPMISKERLQELTLEDLATQFLWERGFNRDGRDSREADKRQDRFEMCVILVPVNA